MIGLWPTSDLDRGDELVSYATHDLKTGLRWPEPTAPEPDFVALAGFILNACAEATDGCLVEPDGTCEHGHPSWLRRLGVI